MALAGEGDVEEAYTAGRKFLDEQKYEEAFKQFDRAYSRSKLPRLLYWMGQASMQGGKISEAVGYFEQFLNINKDTSPAKRQEVKGLIAGLKKAADVRERITPAGQAPVAINQKSDRSTGSPISSNGPSGGLTAPPPTAATADTHEIEVACDRHDHKKVLELYRLLSPRSQQYARFYCEHQGIGVFPSQQMDAETLARASAEQIQILAQAAQASAEQIRILDQASAQLEHDPKEALKLALPVAESARSAKSAGRAWYLVAKAACLLKDKDTFFSAYQHLDSSKRKETHELCIKTHVLDQ